MRTQRLGQEKRKRLAHGLELDMAYQKEAANCTGLSQFMFGTMTQS
jgi:hypothetical protein